MHSQNEIPERLYQLSAQDFLTLKGLDKYKLVTWIKNKSWSELHLFADNLPQRQML